MDTLDNIHPGEILLEEFLNPMGISQNRLANAISVSPRRINEIVLGKRSVTADTALRLAKVFGTSVQFWMGLQAEYELREVRIIISEQLKHLQPIVETKPVPALRITETSFERYGLKIMSKPRKEVVNSSQRVGVNMSGKKVFVEQRPQGDYAVRRPNSERASAVLPTQAKAIARARELSDGGKQ